MMKKVPETTTRRRRGRKTSRIRRIRTARTSPRRWARPKARFVNDSLWDLDPADADDAKALFLTRAYVRDAEAESALAGRVLKWAHSACTHCDVLRAKARRKEGKSRARAREK